MDISAPSRSTKGNHVRCPRNCGSDFNCWHIIQHFLDFHSITQPLVIFKGKHNIYIFKIDSIKLCQLIFLLYALGNILILNFQIFLLFQDCQAFARTLHFSLFRKCFRSPWFYIVFSYLGRSYSWAQNLQTSVLSTKCIHHSFPDTWKVLPRNPLGNPAKVWAPHKPPPDPGAEPSLLISPLWEPLPESDILQITLFTNTKKQLTLTEHLEDIMLSMNKFSFHLLNNTGRWEWPYLYIRKWRLD